MNCEHISQYIASIDFEQSAEPLSFAINEHLKKCDACMKNHQKHLTYLQKIHSVPTPNLHPSIAAKMLHDVCKKGQEKQQKEQSFVKGFIAASVLALSVLGAYTGISHINHVDTELLATQTQFIDKNISIVIHSKSELVDAELNLTLPQQVAIAGYKNIQELTWPIDLKAGANVLELPVRVNMKHLNTSNLNILATLYHEADERDFEINIDLTKS